MSPKTWILGDLRAMIEKEHTKTRSYRFSRQFEESYAALPDEIIDAFEKKLKVFLNNMFHPSFRTKKIKGFKKRIIWEASLTMDYRLTFELERGKVIVFRNIGKHGILDRRKF